MIKAVLFDMDGLMIDSEPLHYQAFNNIFQKYGNFLPKEENDERYIGITDTDAAEDMVQRFGLPLSANQLVKEVQDEYTSIISNGIPGQPGLMELLKDLKNHGYKTSIASGSTREEIEMVIKGLGIEDYMDSYTSAYEVDKGKPAPDVFLEAAERLGVKPEECLVLEDAPSGILGAKLAGMLRYAVPTEQTKDKDFSLANRVLKSLSEAFENLQKDAATA